MTPGVGVTILYFVYIFKNSFLKEIIKKYFFDNINLIQKEFTKRIFLKEHIKKFYLKEYLKNIL